MKLRGEKIKIVATRKGTFHWQRRKKKKNYKTAFKTILICKSQIIAFHIISKCLKWKAQWKEYHPWSHLHQKTKRWKMKKQKKTQSMKWCCGYLPSRSCACPKCIGEMGRQISGGTQQFPKPKRMVHYCASLPKFRTRQIRPISLFFYLPFLCLCNSNIYALCTHHEIENSSARESSILFHVFSKEYFVLPLVIFQVKWWISNLIGSHN